MRSVAALSVFVAFGGAVVLLLGLASVVTATELAVASRVTAAAATAVAVGDDEEGSGGGDGSGGGGGGGVRGPKKRPDWLQPVLPQTVPVPKEPSDEKAIRLIQQMKKPWEGMEDPRLEQTEEGARQAMAMHAKLNGEKKITSAGADGNEADVPKPKAKRRAVVPLLPPVHVQRTLLWDPEDVLAKRWTPVADDWDRKAEKKVVDGMTFHPLRLFSERVSPMWASDVRRMHNQRYVQKHKLQKKYIPPNMRLNPPFFPHVVARYTDRVPATDLNANPVEWPVAPRYIGEKPHGPYDAYHENVDRYLTPIPIYSWRQRQKARPNTIWPEKVQFPRMPAPGDTYNQMVELDTHVTATHHDQDQVEAEAEAEDEAEEAADADAEDEAAEEEDASFLAVEAETEAEAEAEAEAEMTPQQMYWYWVQPEDGRDRFGRDGRLFTPPHPLHPMHQFMSAADAATGHSNLHTAPGPHPMEVYIGKRLDRETGIKPVKTQVQAEPFDPSGSLNVADLQRRLDVYRENPARAAEAMLTDDRLPYLYTAGKPDEADYKKAPRPSTDNQYDEADKERAKKIKSRLSPWKMGAEGDLADHPNFPYASYRRSWLGEPRGLAVPMRPPSLVYQHIKAGAKTDFPVSYGGEQKEKPKAALIQLHDKAEAEDEGGADEEAENDEAETEAGEESEEEESDSEAEGEADDSLVLLQLRSSESESEAHARAHIPSALHADPPVYAYRAPPAPIRLDENGNPIAPATATATADPYHVYDAPATVAVEVSAEAEAEGESEAEAEAETEVKAKAKTKVERVLTPAEKKPWWATKAGRARNAMSESQRRLVDRKNAEADPAHVLDQPLFRSAYSAPVASDAEGEEAADRPHGSAAALMDSLAALARNPLSDAANVFAGQPKSAADRAMADVGRDQAMAFAGIDEDAPRAGPDANSEVMDSASASSSAAPSGAEAMRFRQSMQKQTEMTDLTQRPAKSESAATFAADPNSFARTLENLEGAHPTAVADADADAEGDAMRFAGAKFGPPEPAKDAKSGYGVGLRGMILTQDAAIIAGPNRFRSPTLVNPYSIAMARAQQPYGPAGPVIPNGGSPYPNFPYNYPYGVPAPTPAPVPALVPGSATTAYGPRGLKTAAASTPTTVVNIYGASGAVAASGAAPAPASTAAAAAAAPYPFAAPAPVPAALPYGDTYPPSAGPFPPPLSGLMDIAASMHGHAAPGSSGHPPPSLYGHPFQKVPVPQFPPSSPTVPYPRYPMGPVGALAESGWQKPRLIPIVYGSKV